MSLVKTETRSLMCVLTEQDLLERGDELAKTYMEIAALDMQKKRIAAQIKPKDERIEQLVVIIDTKEEERRVDCQWQYEWDAGVKKLIRMDTGAVVDTGEIKDWERQQQLPISTGSSSLQDLADVCPKCEGEGEYIEDGIEGGGGEVYCDCPAGIALKEDETNAGSQEKEETEGAEAAAPADGDASGAGADAPVKTDCTVCREESGCDQCCKTCETKCHNEMICRVDESREMAGTSLCAVCLGLCGDFTPGTQVSECPGFSADPSPEMINHYDTVCMDEWRQCEHANACFGPANEDGPCDCLAAKAKKESKHPYVEPEKDGVTADRLETLQVELKHNSLKNYQLQLQVSQGDTGAWYNAFSFQGPNGGHSYAAYPKFSERYPDRSEAINAAAEIAYNYILGHLKNDKLSEQIRLEIKAFTLSQGLTTAAPDEQPALADLCASCHKAAGCDDCCHECLSPCNTQQKCTWPGAEEKATAPEAGKVTALQEARAKRAKLIKTPKGAKK